MTNKEYKELVQKWKDRYDFIYEVYEYRDCTEIIGSIGGDVERIRVYKDGEVGMK